MILIRVISYVYSRQLTLMTLANWIERISISFYLSSYYIKHYEFNLNAIIQRKSRPNPNKCPIRILQ